MLPPLGFPSDEYEIKGNAGQILGLASNLKRSGTTFKEKATELEQTRPNWQGPERTMWDLLIRPMVGKLNQAGDCYITVGGHFGVFGDKISSLQSQMGPERETGQAAYNRMNAARHRVLEAGGRETLEKLALGPVSFLFTGNEKEIATQGAIMWSANGELDASRGRAAKLRGEATTAAAECSAKINSVPRPAGLPVPKPQGTSLWDKVVDGAQSVWNKTTQAAGWAYGEVTQTAADIYHWGQRHVGAFFQGLGPFGEALVGNGKLWGQEWLYRLGFTNEHPKPVQFFAGAALLFGTGGGALANLWTGKDQNFLDDGQPVTYNPYVLDPSKYNDSNQNDPTKLYVPLTNFSALTRDTMSAYGDVSDNSGQNRDRSEPRVIAIRNPGQPTRYVVTIPGTDADLDKIHGGRPGWSLNDNGHNWAANLWGVAFGENTYSKATQEAIDRAIAMDQQAHGESGRPDVLLTGHSQGGITAANVASNDEFARKYNVRGVVTYGSPIEASGGQNGAPTLALQNGTFGVGYHGSDKGHIVFGGDPVPNLDLNPGNPSNVTQVNLPAPNPVISQPVKQVHVPFIGNVPVPSGAPTLSGDVFRPNHEQAGYINNVNSLDGANQAAVQQFEKDNQLSQFYVDPNGTTTVYVAPAGAK